MDVKGKVALVTGAAKGLGFAFVQELLRNGAKGVSVLDLESSNGKDSVHKLNEEFGSGRAIFVICDVTKSEELEGGFERTVDRFGGLDIVINNAGIMQDKFWELMIKINFTAVVRGSLLALRYMGKDKGGKGGVLVNVSSIAGFRVADFIPVYVGSKHAVLGFSRSLGLPSLYEKTGVRVLTICPGATDTDLVSGGRNKQLDLLDAEILESIIDNLPCQRIETVARGMMHIIRTAESGSAWVAENDEPIRELEFPSYC